MNQLSTKKFIIASLLCAPFFFVACGDDITEEIEKSEIQTEENGVRWARPERQLVVTISQTDENATRVVLVDGKYITPKSSGVKATWETTDKVGVWNSTAFAKGQNGYNTVSPNSNTQHTNFVGTVNCSKGDKISLFYPYGNGTGVTTSSDGMLTLDLQSQNGTLEEISKKFDLVYGEATISSVSNGEASASLGTLTSGITILELQFQDTENENAQIEFDHLEIQVEDGHNMATLNLNNIADGLTMIGGNTFDIRPDTLVTKVYVALFGETAGKTLRFSIIDKYGFQHQASAKAPTSVTAGQITRANLKAKDGKFIEFGGTKFAKGNLLWDCGTMVGVTNMYAQAIDLHHDSYFIAPSQEWSPEQLVTVNQGGEGLSNMPVWPVGARVHNDKETKIHTVPHPGEHNAYYETFYYSIAGLNGESSARGRVITPGSTVPSGGATSTVVNANPPQDIVYRERLWDDQSLGKEITLQTALSTYNQVRHFSGDLAYLVSEGEYATPTIEELRKIFEHSNICWGVVFVSDNGQTSAINMKVGTKHKEDNTLLPIYGLYLNKTKNRQEMESSNGVYEGSEWGNENAWIDSNKKPAYKGCAVILTEEDLKQGIFLPAGGMRKATVASGGLEWVDGSYKPGEYATYLTATFGAGGLGSRNARHWVAKPDNHGFAGTGGNDGQADVETYLNNEQRTMTGNLRPIYIGDIFK